jgi:hypothetical protein
MLGRSEEVILVVLGQLNLAREAATRFARVPLHEERAFAYPCSLACASQKLNKQLTDLFRLLLSEPVSRSINKMSTAHLRAGGALHPLECAGNLENTPVALSAYE